MANSGYRRDAKQIDQVGELLQAFRESVLNEDFFDGMIVSLHGTSLGTFIGLRLVKL